MDRFGNFFEPIEPGWFLQWAVENESKKHPKSSVSVYLRGEAICGFIPIDWDGSHIQLQARDDIKVE